MCYHKLERLIMKFQEGYPIYGWLIFMVEYLEELVSKREFGSAVEYAENLIQQGNWGAEQLLRIYCAQLTSFMYLGENEAGMNAGLLAVRLSEQARAWDHYGRACLDLGVVQYRVGEVADAINSWLSYLTKLPYYSSSLQHEALAWYNLWRGYTTLGDITEASKALHRALLAADRMGNGRHAHGIRQALIDAFMMIGDLTPIPSLLAKCSYYLRKNSHLDDSYNSMLWLIKVRVEYLIYLNKLDRARRVAVRGLRISTDDHRLQFTFHSLLARIALQESDYVTAFAHASVARTYAMSCRRVDLEAEASNVVYDIIKQHPWVPTECDLRYSALG